MLSTYYKPSHKSRTFRRARIRFRLEHQGRHRGDENGLDDSLLPMPRDIADDLATASGMADHGRIFQIQMVHKLGESVGVLIHVVALPTLARTSMATPVMGNHAVSSLREKQHLRVPGIGAQRPSMRKGDDRPGAPVLVVDGGSSLVVNVFISLFSFTFSFEGMFHASGSWVVSR